MLLTPGLSSLDGTVSGTIAHAAVGAIGAGLTGGNPLDGALRGATAYLFNQIAESKLWGRPETLEDHFQRHGAALGAKDARTYLKFV